MSLPETKYAVGYDRDHWPTARYEVSVSDGSQSVATMQVTADSAAAKYFEELLNYEHDKYTKLKAAYNEQVAANGHKNTRIDRLIEEATQRNKKIKELEARVIEQDVAILTLEHKLHERRSSEGPLGGKISARMWGALQELRHGLREVRSRLDDVEKATADVDDRQKLAFANVTRPGHLVFGLEDRVRRLEEKNRGLFS